MSTLTEQILARLKELQEQMRHYGLIMGGALVFVELMQYWMYSDITSRGIITFTFLKIAIVFLVSIILVKRIRGEFFKRGMSYLQCFSIIFRLFIYGALFAGLFVFVLNNWIAPEFQAKTTEGMVAFLENNIQTLQLPAEQLKTIENMIDEIAEAPAISASTIMWSKMWSYITLGGFVAFILSFFLKDSKKIKDTTTIVVEEDKN